MSEFVNFYLFPALTIGSIYALGAVGISMIFGILRFAHFAHGDLMTLGAYGSMAASALMPVNPLLLIPFGMALTIFSALFVDRFFYRPLRDLPTIYTVISSFGIALVFRSMIQLVWGSENQVLAGEQAAAAPADTAAAPVAALTAQLRARFDPRGILNPGLMAA